MDPATDSPLLVYYLLKGPYSTALLALACSYVALHHPAQPCPALNTSTTSSASPCLLNLALP